LARSTRRGLGIVSLISPIPSVLGVPGNRAVAATARLHALAVDTRGPFCGKAALTSLLAAIVVDVFEVERVDVAGKVAKNGQADVDQQIRSAASNGINTDGRDCIGGTWRLVCEHIWGDRVAQLRQKR
jgi:hypothetical protein